MEKIQNKKSEKIGEKVLEKKLVEGVKKLGGKALKFSSITDTSYPDRIVMLPGAKTFWVELKSTGKIQTKLQALRCRELSELGFETFVIDTEAKLDVLLMYLRTKLDPITNDPMFQ